MEPRVTAAGVRKKPSGSDVTPSFFLLVHAMKVTATCKTKKKTQTVDLFCFLVHRFASLSLYKNSATSMMAMEERWGM
jgi:hypothetical protein